MSYVPYKFTDMQITDKQRQIFLENQALIPYFLKQHFKSYFRSFDYDDLYQIASFGLLRAIQLYKPSKSSFSTYASHHIRGVITHYFRKFLPVGRRKPSDAMAYAVYYENMKSENGQCESDFLDFLTSPYSKNDIESLDAGERFLQILQPVNLTNEEIEVLTHRMHSSKSSYEDQAAEIGKSKDAFEKFNRSALGKLKRYYSQNPLPSGFSIGGLE